MARLLFSAAAFIFLCGFGDTAYFANKRGNDLYKQGRYEEALKEYENAKMGELPSKEVDYNRGNALFKLGRFSEAALAYSKALETDKPGLKKNSGYNRGTAFYKAGEKAREGQKLDEAGKLFDESVKQLKASLKDDPSDNEARHNLELALKKLEETEQQKKKDDQDKKEGDGQKDSQQQSGQDGDEDKKEKERTGEDENDKQGDEQPAHGDPTQITPEQAKQIFDAIEQDERNLRGEMRRKDMKDRPKSDKDW